MENPPLIVDVLEGPAGAGKSTLVSEFLGRGYVAAPRPESAVRDYGELGKSGEIYHSLKKDMDTLLYLATTGYENVVVDRLLLSGFVYEALRYGRDEVDKFNQMFDMYIGELVRFARLTEIRGFDRNTTGKIRFHVLLPTPGTLVANRESSRRKFPFSPVEELTKYTQLAYHMKTTLIPAKSKDLQNLGWHVSVNMLAFSSEGRPRWDRSKATLTTSPKT